MMPKYRVWDEYTGRIHDVVGFDFIETEVHYENYAEAEALIHARDFKDVELMQSTGLKDKNNNEIYAGDIVEFDISVAYEYDILNKAIVTMSNVGGVKPTLFTMEECGDVVEWSYFEKDIDELDFFDDCKVVGNIYETPHLL
ncbi:TPA: hypothetical protein SGA28_000541 [Staphylococcus aureus]|uniref:YopX protein domain-containing protein n=4 Tax=root TaxID=1 RepID=A0A2I6PE09_9CAUD|nr:YopX family protein [Staphylococcus aureus]AUM57974.1 hypothetical protein [Staphylococcus phage phiSa2wa_st72]UUV45288.1 YopX-like protein [Staphylococcus phage SAP3_TA-2022]AQQ89346.1 hypothetical protein AYM15_04685 [Staphylococcus aureus]AQQ92289.1 hypothetical protein AYM16_04695 [Staphylococcus aureus]AQQ95228.1 hypothetical protein AYM18_04695 [Staphylococcus aureus]